MAFGRVAIPGCALAPVIVVIPGPADGCKPGAFDGEWLPPTCPGYGAAAVIGHGRRSRQAHDRDHEPIRIRRGLCNRCRLTLTVLPAWCVPDATYNLPARQEALDRLAAGSTLEEAAPAPRVRARVRWPKDSRHLSRDIRAGHQRNRETGRAAIGCSRPLSILIGLPPL